MTLPPKERIILIVTCYNRLELTKAFLRSVESSTIWSDNVLDVLLVDDASPDNTGVEIRKAFPKVEVIFGNGELYWAGGVRLALDYLDERLGKYGKILLANDDIEFHPGAIAELVHLSNTNQALVGGAVVTRDGRIESTGGRLGRLCKPKPRWLQPNGEVQECDLLPGHVLLIPIDKLEQLGGFDPKLPYRFLDLDITIRASRAGVNVLLAPTPLALTNDYHDYFTETSAMRGTVRELTRSVLLSPKGPYWRESLYYLRKVDPVLWWLWFPFFYRAFFKAVVLSEIERVVDFLSAVAKFGKR